MTRSGKWAFSGIAGLVAAGLVGCTGIDDLDATTADEAQITSQLAYAGAGHGPGKPGRPNPPHGRPSVGKPKPPHAGGLCDGNGGRGGGGGSTGAGGSGGPGGSTGGGGAPGPVLCTGTVPPSPLITGSVATVAFPSSGYTYSAPGLVAPVVTPNYSSDGVWQSLTAVINPGATTDPANNWVGFGVPLIGCVDASAYTGVRFTVAGDLGTCALSFVAVPTQQNADEFGGSCTEDTCYAPASAPFGLGTTTIRFADLVGGNPPGLVDASRLMDLSWQLNVPTDGATAPCAANLTISDVTFVTN